MRLFLTVVAVLLAIHGVADSQERYDLLLKQGHVIDPANQIDAVMDVAIAGGKIARVAANISPNEAQKVIDAQGLYVTPGLIDLHAHVFGYSGSIFPDDTSLIAGTTTVVDAGGSGWRTFDDMYERVIKPSRTRVLALINIVGHGMIGSKYQDDVNDMDPEKTAAKIAERRDHIVGIKIAHFGGSGWVAHPPGIAAGKSGEGSVMIDDHIFTNSGRNDPRKAAGHDEARRHAHAQLQRPADRKLINRFNGKVAALHHGGSQARGVCSIWVTARGSFFGLSRPKPWRRALLPDTISTDLHDRAS